MAGQRGRRRKNARANNFTSVATDEMDVDEIDLALIHLKKQHEPIINNVKVPIRWLLTIDEMNERKRLLETDSKTDFHLPLPSDQELAQYMIDNFVIPVDKLYYNEDLKKDTIDYKPKEAQKIDPKEAQKTGSKKELKGCSSNNNTMIELDGETTDEASYDIPITVTRRKRFTRGREKEEETEEEKEEPKEREKVKQKVRVKQKEKVKAKEIVQEQITVRDKDKPKLKVTPKKESPVPVKNSPICTRSNSPMVNQTNSFRCEHCDKSYKDSGSLNKHVANLHKNLIKRRI